MADDSFYMAQYWESKNAAAMIEWETADKIRAEAMRPSTLYRPRIFPDGNAWCALLGDNIQDGVAGFGASPDAAFRAFDAAWHEQRA